MCVCVTVRERERERERESYMLLIQGRKIIMLFFVILILMA